MDIMEIILLIAGGVIFVLSFFIPDKKGASAAALSQEDARAMLDRELEAVRKSLDEAAEESVSGAMEKTERSLERLSNEKIMAVSEYSDTVLTEIHKNHEEVMFLYDMLNNKHTSLKNTAAEVNRAVKEAEEAIAALRRQMNSEEAMAALKRQMEAGEAGVTLKRQIDSEEAMTALRRQMGAGDAENGEQPHSLSGGYGSAAETGSAWELEEKSTAVPGRDDIPDSSEYGSNKERIRSLYRQGKSVADIARELELGVGEVKLVIDLFQG